LTLNAAARLLASPKDNDEELDDLRDKAADEIKVLHAASKIPVANIRKHLLEVKATFHKEEGFEAWLQQEELPSEKELSDLMDLGMAGASED